MSVAQLIEAVKKGNIDKVKELIEAGVDVNLHGDEQEWTPLNYAAGKGDLEIVNLLVERGGADVFKVVRDRRTPYKIALAACRVEVAKYLRDAEEKAGGDKEKISSREGENRPYCKAYHLKNLRKFPNWFESKVNWKEKKDDKDGFESENQDKGFSDDDVVFLHQDFTVTQSMWHNENIIFNQVTPEWKEFCINELKFKVPDDFDLIPKEPITSTEASP
ncbi:ankyrin repeat domain-containing protein [bacterium]|nr:ankyrin repeat domain-containing protein [bacterium]